MPSAPRAAVHQVSGWSADVRRDERGAVSRRLDLGELLFGEPSVVPGVGSGRVSRARLAEVLAELVGLPRVLTVDGRSVGREGLPAQLPQTDTRPEGSTLVDRVARELTRMGFADVVPDSTCSRLESDIFRVEWWNRSKSVGLGDVQRLYGSAAARRRRLMVVTENSATRPARAFADDAGVYVFVVDPGDRRLAACNDLAREVVLDESTWLPARGLVDRSPV